MVMVDPRLLATEDVAVLPTDRLEEGICTFTARLAAATCVYVLALAEYDRREAWAEWGCRSMAHWLSWRCGLTLTTAREHVRVGRALRGLPLLRDRFVAGRFTYSQVRALTRAATAETEADLIVVAENATAAQLEAICRGVAHARALADGEDDAVMRAKRGVEWRGDDDGSVVMVARMTPEDAAVIRRALQVCSQARRRDGLERPVPDADRPTAEDPVGAGLADALTDVAAAYLSDARSDDTSGDPQRYTVTVVVDAETLAGQPRSGADGAEGVCETEEGMAISPATAARLACDQPSVTIVEDRFGRVLDVGRRTRRIPRRLRRALSRRDHGRCGFPGCPARRVEAHHVTHWAKGGATSIDNLVSLCAFHHHRHHDGIFTITATAQPGRFDFARADGQPIERAPAPASTGGATDVGIEPTAPDCVTGWDGTRMDLSWVVGVLVQQPDQPLDGRQAPVADDGSCDGDSEGDGDADSDRSAG